LFTQGQPQGRYITLKVYRLALFIIAQQTTLTCSRVKRSTLRMVF